MERARAEWDAAADGFDAEPDHGLLVPGVRAAWWELLQSLLPAAPARVADLGCGTGTISVLLAEHGYDVAGVDLSPRMVERAHAKADAAGCSIQFHVGDASEPPLTAAAFDVVFARHVVWALPEPGSALERWADLLTPGGRFVLVEGLWATGAGRAAETVRGLLPPVMQHVDVVPLTDPTLWGGPIDDVRYALVARQRSVSGLV